MKILFVITGLGIGGAERLVLNLADKMAEKGHTVAIISLTGPSLFLPINADIQITDLNMTKGPLGLFRAYWNLCQLVAQFRPDVVHSHMVHANIFTRLVRLFSPMGRLVCTAHNKYEGGRLRMLSYRLTNFLADISTNVSREAVEAFEHMKAVPKGQMLAVYNGIDCNVFSPKENSRIKTRESLLVSESCVVFVAVGRLVDAKDYPNLLNAYALTCTSLTNSMLWIVGDGPLRQALEGLAIELGIQKRVVFFGVRHDIAQLLRAADVFVLSSAWEGFGLVVAEAMATGLIAVATNCGGVAEVVGDWGILVPPEDSRSLSAALFSAATMPSEDARKIKLQARQRIVQQFSLDVAVDKWLKIYSGDYS